MNQKGNISLIALAVFGAILALGVGVGVRYYTQKTTRLDREAEQTQASQQGERKQTFEEMVANWNTYTHPEFNFEIKYPSDWIEDPDASAMGQTTFYPSKFFPFWQDSETIVGVDVGSFTRNRESITLEESVDLLTQDLLRNGAKIIESSPTTLLGKPAHRYVITATVEAGSVSVDIKDLTILTNRNGIDYEVRYIANLDKYTSYLEIAQAMIDSFKFREASLTSEPEDIRKRTKEVVLDKNCDVYPVKLDSCSAYRCQFKHPFTGELMQKEILGFVDGVCSSTEEMPNNGKMECKYNEGTRKAIVQYLKNLVVAESVGVSVKSDLINEPEVKYTIDDKEIVNPLQEAINTGQCIISGY